MLSRVLLRPVADRIATTPFEMLQALLQCRTFVGAVEATTPDTTVGLIRVAFSRATFSFLVSLTVVEVIRSNLQNTWLRIASFGGVLPKALLQSSIGSVAPSMLGLILTQPFTVVSTVMLVRGIGLADACTDVWQRGGVTGFYAGLNISLIGVVIYRFIYLTVRGFFRKHNHAYISVIAGWFAYPIDTIRRYHILTNGTPAELSSWTVMTQLGVLGLWAGAAVSLLRGIVSSYVANVLDRALRF